MKNTSKYTATGAYIPIKTKGNIMVCRGIMDMSGRYPRGLDDCFVIGINGDCNTDCPIFKDGECPNENEIIGFEQ